MSSIPVSAHSTDCSQAKAAGAQDQNPDVPSLSNHQADSNSAEHDRERDSTDKLDKKEKKLIKKKSPFLPGNSATAFCFLCCKECSNLWLYKGISQNVLWISYEQYFSLSKIQCKV